MKKKNKLCRIARAWFTAMTSLLLYVVKVSAVMFNTSTAFSSVDFCHRLDTRERERECMLSGFQWVTNGKRMGVQLEYLMACI